jgi:succinyl-CoA synthetase alpha subunit
MVSLCRVEANLYRDSVTLMQLSANLAALPGIEQAYAVMGTPNNLGLLRDAGVVVEQISGKPNDLVIVVEGASEQAVSDALAQADAELYKEEETSEEATQKVAARSIGMGLQELPEANLALISTPGEYAAAEAIKALNVGLHVMMFSDNVSLEDEIQIKHMAHERGLLVMGPDCGTAIVNGIPLGFANAVRRGKIGVIGASGTGLQQVTSLVDLWGRGVSQAIGTGSRDLHERVGGVSMLDALDALAADPDTEVIVLVSKPPALEVARRVLERARQVDKPVVVDFIGARPNGMDSGALKMVSTLDEAAAAAVTLAGGTVPREGEADARPAQLIRFAAGQRYLRGLFSGGTFSYESTLILHAALGAVYSNTPVEPEHKLENAWASRGHTTVDLGDDEFTRGRPHPMIDYRLRIERLLNQAHDPEVALILLDVVLGYGSHPDPASELVPAIEQARKVASAAGRSLVFVASVCGTERDPQQVSRQAAALRQAGVLLGRSNAEAARLATRVLCEAGVPCSEGWEKVLV